MTNNFSLGKNNKFGLIDFTKFKSGLEKSELKSTNFDIESIFNLIDTDGNEVLSVEEIRKLQEELSILDKNSDGNLLESELSKFNDKNGKRIGRKAARDLANLLNLINEHMEEMGIENVERSEQGEVIKYTNGNTETIQENFYEITNNKNEYTRYFEGVEEKSYEDENQYVHEVYDDKGNLIHQEKKIKNNGKIVQKQIINIKNGVEQKTVKDLVNNITYVYVDGNLITTKMSDSEKITYNEKGYERTTCYDNKTRFEVYDNQLQRLTYVSEESKLEDGSRYKIVSSLNDDIVTTKTYINGKVRSEIIEVGNDAYYYAEYDGQGNTKTFVQFGESPADIAKKFGVSLENLLELNKDKIKTDEQNNKYFDVGAEILIPKIIRANASVLIERNSQEVEVQKFNNYKKELAIKEEYEKFLAEQKRVLDLYQAAIDEKNKKRDNAASVINNINDKFVASSGFFETQYGYKDGHTNAILEGVTEDNVVEVLEAIPNLLDEFNKRSDNWGTDSKNRQKCEHIKNALLERAEKAGVPKDIISHYKNIDFYEEYVLYYETSKKVFAQLVEIINAYETLTIAEERAKLLNEPFNQETKDFITNLCYTKVENADKIFREQTNSNGWVGNLADAWAECFWDSDNTAWDVEDDLAEAYAFCQELADCNLDKYIAKFKEEHDGREPNEEELKVLKQSVGEDFKTKFKEFFGVYPDPVILRGFLIRGRQITEYKKLDSVMVALEKQKDIMLGHDWESFVGGRAVENHDLGVFERLAQASKSPKTNVYKEFKVRYPLTINGKTYDSLEEYDKAMLEEAIEYVGGKEAVLERLRITYENPEVLKITDWRFVEAVGELYELKIYEEINKIKEPLDEILELSGCKSYKELETAYNNSLNPLFGKNDKIMERVLNYCKSQQKAINGIKTGLNIVTGGTAIVAGAVSGGTLTPILYGSFAAIAPTVIEMTDLMTCNNAKNYAGGRLEYSIDNIDWEDKCEELVLNAISVGVGIKVVQFTANLSKSLKFACMSASDITMGAASEIIISGDITIDGIIYNAVFSVMGNTIGLKDLKKKTQPENATKGANEVNNNLLNGSKSSTGQSIGSANMPPESLLQSYYKMKNAVDFDKILTTIKTKFDNFKTHMNELLDNPYNMSENCVVNDGTLALTPSNSDRSMNVVGKNVGNDYNRSNNDVGSSFGAKNVGNDYNSNEARKQAYAKYNENQVSVELKGEGVLRQDMQYALDMNNLPEMHLYDGTTLDFSKGELRTRIKNLKEGEYFTIGRDGDIKVGNENISRQHILVTMHNGRIVVKDISLIGGTSVRFKNVTSSKVGNTEKPTRREHVKELRAELGAKLARLYVRIEKAIENMKSAVDFDKISSKIKLEFANFKTHMNELLNLLDEKVRSIRATSRKSKPENHADFVRSRRDLFEGVEPSFGTYWAQYKSTDRKHGAWKMHLYSVDELDWQEMCEVVIPYLKENDIDWKTFNSYSGADCLNNTQQQGKAFTIYPRDNEHMAQIAKDLDALIRRHKLEKNGTSIVGDRALGDSGRIFYRYEFKSGKYANDIIDFNENYNAYLNRYDSNRGNGPYSYLADDMTTKDDIWRDFDPSDPNSRPYSSYQMNKGESYPLENIKTLRLADYDLDIDKIKNYLSSLPEGGCITVGREGTIRIPENYIHVSGIHLVIYRSKGVLYVIDESSTNGTKIIS